MKHKLKTTEVDPLPAKGGPPGRYAELLEAVLRASRRGKAIRVEGESKYLIDQGLRHAMKIAGLYDQYRASVRVYDGGLVITLVERGPADANAEAK